MNFSIFRILKAVLFLAGLGAVFAVFLRFHDSLAFENSPSSKGRGVVRFDRLRAQPGFNLVEGVYPQGKASCVLMDMDGRIALTLGGEFCLVTSDGGYLRARDFALERVDQFHHLLWKSSTYIHHDMAYDSENGESFVWGTFLRQEVQSHFPTNVDVLRGFDRAGKLIFEWDTRDHVPRLENIFAKKLRFTRESGSNEWEFSHFNSIQILPANPLESAYPAFRKGNLLVSTIIPDSALLVIDRKTGQIVWSLIDEHSTNIHSARLMPDGTLLYFQNDRWHLEGREDSLFSRIMRIDPVSGREIWSFVGREPDVFFASHNGSVDQLENGDFLVTHKSNGGGAFEVTPKGRIVWEWVNSADNPVLPADIVRFRRIPTDQALSLIENAAKLEEFERRKYFEF